MRVSTAQHKILSEMAKDSQLRFDDSIGFFTLITRGEARKVDQRVIDAMLRSGALVQDMLGRCSIAPGLDIAESLAVKKTHCLDEDGEILLCRYTSHARARATFALPSTFRALDRKQQCTACLKRLGDA